LICRSIVCLFLLYQILFTYFHSDKEGLEKAEECDGWETIVLDGQTYGGVRTFHSGRKVPDDSTVCALPTHPVVVGVSTTASFRMVHISWLRPSPSQMIVPTSIDVRDASARSFLPTLTYVVPTPSTDLHDSVDHWAYAYPPPCTPFL